MKPMKPTLASNWPVLAFVGLLLWIAVISGALYWRTGAAWLLFICIPCLLFVVLWGLANAQ